MSRNLEKVDGMSERRVLVFPAGTEIGLEIHAALRGYHHVKLFAAGEDISNHARFVYPEYHVIPNVHTNCWLQPLIELCKRLDIQYIFPAHDDVIVTLSAVRDRIPAKLVTSNHDACVTTRSKSATYRRLTGILPVPLMYPSAAAVTRFPVLLKPDKGQGSSHVTIANTREQLAIALTTVPEPIICEYLPGEEFTVDCFSSQSQGLLFVGARQRRRTRNGISVNTVTEDLPEAWPLADAIGRELKPRGAWFFQLKRNAGGELVLLEVAPRIAGAMAAHRVCGVNFPLLAMMELEDAKLHIAPNKMRIEMDRALSNRYRSHVKFDTLYLDLDDTMLCGSTLEENVARLICRCINQEIHLVLITERGVESSGVARKLGSLFDEVLQVSGDEPRSSVIRETSSIYVDNNPARRIEVSRTRRIPTFDTSMIELLHNSAEGLSFRGNAE
jgi:hypothetical protein